VSRKTNKKEEHKYIESKVVKSWFIGEMQKKEYVDIIKP